MNQSVRTQLLVSLQAKLVAAEAELAKFTINSKAAAAIALRTTVVDLRTRIAAMKIKADRATVVDNETGAVDEKLSAQDAAYAKLNEARDDFMRVMGIASGKRALIAWVSGVVVAFGAGFAGGTLLDMLVIGAMAFTGSAFLALLTYVVGLVLVVYASMKLGSAAYNYVAHEHIDAHYGLVRAWVGYKGTQIKSLFASDKVAAPAAA